MSKNKPVFFSNDKFFPPQKKRTTIRVFSSETTSSRLEEYIEKETAKINKYKDDYQRVRKIYISKINKWLKKNKGKCSICELYAESCHPRLEKHISVDLDEIIILDIIDLLFTEGYNVTQNYESQFDFDGYITFQGWKLMFN